MRNSHEESYERLKHTEKAIATILNYTAGIQESDFSGNLLLIDAVLFQFTVIGEAIKHVESEKLSNYDYPWYKIRAFRNFIAHEYYEINNQAVWNVIKQDVPKLKKLIETILRNEF
ncbi:MAG: DUF86 domain-containing protein [Bacteroidales bacterium]|nr:DUF86 domain-containing protein [Bacteroidales bacterium]